jgi:hypothetical protein
VKLATPVALLVTALVLVGCMPTGPGAVSTESAATAASPTSESTTPAAATTAAQPPITPLPAWTAPTKCLKAAAIQKILNSEDLKRPKIFATYPSCSYGSSTTNFGYYLESDALLVDTTLRAPSASFAAVPALGSGAVKLTATTKLGTIKVGTCAYIVRLDRDHGASTQDGDLRTTLKVSVTRPGAKPQSLCSIALALLTGISSPTVFAPGFEPLPRFSVNCSISAAQQGTKLRKFVIQTLKRKTNWADDARFEPLVRHTLNEIDFRCNRYSIDDVHYYIADTVSAMQISDGYTRATVSQWLDEF